MVNLMYVVVMLMGLEYIYCIRGLGMVKLRMLGR